MELSPINRWDRGAMPAPSTPAQLDATARRRVHVAPERHRWLDNWKIASGDMLKGLVSEVLDHVADRERQLGLRRRSRRPIDDHHHRLAVETLVCNLVHAVLVPPPTARIAVRLGHGSKGKSRYENRALGKSVSGLVWLLEDLGHLAIFTPKAIRGEVTSIAPSPAFARRVHELRITLKDMARSEYEEVLILSRNTKLGRGADRTTCCELIDYRDTETTDRLRWPVRIVNQHLVRADLAVVGPAADGIDVSDRTLRRRLLVPPNQEVRFDQGGRLFGGFWQNMRREDRRAIRIDGEQVVELDYSSMFTRLAYAELGLDPPSGDLYRIPGLEQYRSGVKLAMNCFLFDAGPRRRRWPKEMGIGVGSDLDALADLDGPVAAYVGRLPPGWTVARTRDAILRVHPRLKDAWGEALGYRLMFVESEILLAVSLWLIRAGITALPLHDGLIVPISRKDETRVVMERCAKRKTDVEIPVSEKA